MVIKQVSAYINSKIIFSFGANSPIWCWAALLLRFRDHTHTHKHTHKHTLRHTTLGRISLDEWSFFLTTHNSHNRQTSVRPAAFEPAIPVSERPQTRALDCATNRNRHKQSNYIYVLSREDKSFLSGTRGVTWTKHVEGGQRTEKVNSLINVLYTETQN